MNIDQEWRAMLLGEIKELRKEVHEIKQEMTTLKVKVMIFSSAIGFIASVLKDKIF